MVVDGSSVTSGTILGVFAPSDLSAMQAAGGKFFTFAGKGAGLDMYTWKVDLVQMGALGFTYDKDVVIYGGGNQLTTTRVLAGTVSVTSASPTVTKAGGAFLSEFKRGQSIQIDDGTATFIKYNILSVDSNTQLTLTANYAQTTNGARAYDGYTEQYSPPLLSLEGPQGNHTSNIGDYVYGIFASGGNGQLRVHKSAVLGIPDIPADDMDGNALVTNRLLDNTTRSTSGTTESTILTGYTIPANELMDGTMFRIKFKGQFQAAAVGDTVTYRVKLGGTTILTSTAAQAGATTVTTFNGEIDIVGTGIATQRVGLQVTGMGTAATGAKTHGANNYGTSAIDTRLDRTLTVTAQFSNAPTTAMSIYYSTVEIL